MERQAWKLIVLLLLFCYVHSPYVKAQVGNGKQITMEFKNEGLPSIFKRLQKLSGYKVLFIYDEVRSYHSTGKVEKASIEEVLKVSMSLKGNSSILHIKILRMLFRK